jgi:hypothetical protein
MIFFLVWSLHLLQINKWKLAAVIFAFSVSIKLIPLIFLPLLFKKLGLKKSLFFYMIVGLVTALLFIPFYSEQFLTNYTETVGLWFHNFEFNASFYYIAREIGYVFTGYNQIALIGTFTGVLVLVFVIALSLFRKNYSLQQLITAMLFALSFYYFTASTVHPWYIATLLILSVFTNYKFPLVWSFVIILSYLAYANSNNSENLWFISLEYLIVYSVFLYEILRKNSVENKFLKNI